MRGVVGAAPYKKAFLNVGRRHASADQVAICSMPIQNLPVHRRGHDPALQTTLKKRVGATLVVAHPEGPLASPKGEPRGAAYCAIMQQIFRKKECYVYRFYPGDRGFSLGHPHE